MRLFLDHIGPTDLALALKAADDALKDRMVGIMTPQERHVVTNHMEWLGPIRLTTVQRVQLAIVQAVRSDDPLV
jgi:flagellar motor switch protein FliG